MDASILRQSQDLLTEHEQRAASLPIEDIVVADSALFQQDVWMPYFRRLRQEDPVHYEPETRFGPHWSVTKFNDIKAVDSNWRVFSSDIDRGGIHIGDKEPRHRQRSLITTDPPTHTGLRRSIQPIVSRANLEALEGLIRERTGRVLDELPRDEPFNWVEMVSIELTVLTLATIFDFPVEEKHKLTHWSDVSFIDLNSGGPVDTEEKRSAELEECLETFTRLREEKRRRSPEPDIISMIAHSEAYENVSPSEFLGNLMTLIVGGNDTTRNSMSGSMLLTNKNPDQLQRLRDDPSLMDSMVSEVIRYQTPILAFRRTATQDTELGGKTIREGDRVVMWYISGNRDEDEFAEPDRFLLGRDNYRKHIAFGFGVHRCLGNRLGELQLRVLWEEILARDLHIEVVGAPKWQYSTFIHGILDLPVVVSDGRGSSRAH